MRKGLCLLIVMLIALIPITGCSKTNGITAEQGQVARGYEQSALQVKVLDVGQGDAILIRGAEQVVLVDTGDIEARDKLVAYIKKEGITTIDKVVITHPHADHLGGMIGVLENFKVKQIYDSGQTATTALYRKYLAEVKKQKIPFTLVTAGDEISISNEIKLKILSPEKPFITESAANNNSVVAKLIYNQFSMLLTGDAEREAEVRMVKSYAKELKSTVLKAGHHGSNTSSSSGFLKAVGAEAVVISLGANNDYHHPHPSTLKKYAEAKLNVYRTDLDGTVVISSDGKTYSIAKEK